MTLKSKHIVEELNGVRCTIVEKSISKDRMIFLKNLLEFNKLEVIVTEEINPDDETLPLFTIGVTDIVFNPTTAVYEMSLKTKEGKSVSPAYWEQYTSEIKDEYWTYEPKNNI